MAGQYSQIFTLTDIFNNKNLKGKLPLINYKEIEKEDGGISQRTSVRSVPMQVYDAAVSSARPHFKPLIATKSGNLINIGGNCTTDIDSAVDNIYNSLSSKRMLLVWTANNAEMIRSAIKETEKNKRVHGINSKLYLKAQSMEQIEGMTNQQLQLLLNDVMENIIFGDNFVSTQKKFGIKDILDDQRNLNNGFNYVQLRLRWKYKVGAV